MLEIDKYKQIFVANWKLNGSLSFIKSYLTNIKLFKKPNSTSCVIICPPLSFVNNIKSEGLLIGAQDCSIYKEGSYTGENSAKMLKDIGCSFCIVGHSERRSLFNENNEIILQKTENCIREDLIPILCIGETLEQKKENLTKDILLNQINQCIPDKTNKNNLIIAYEPIWAIGTGYTPTLEEISNIHNFIKNNLPTKHYKILYGGSVKSSNSKNILKLNEVDGVLVGGASINLNEFNKIIVS